MVRSERYPVVVVGAHVLLAQAHSSLDLTDY